MLKRERTVRVFALRGHSHPPGASTSPPPLRNEKDRLLRRYWTIPEPRAQTSLVLADRRWM
jgi:hypothetical protein